MRLGFRVLGALMPERVSRYALDLFLSPRPRPIPKREQGVLDDAQRVRIIPR